MEDLRTAKLELQTEELHSRTVALAANFLVLRIIATHELAGVEITEASARRLMNVLRKEEMPPGLTPTDDTVFVEEHALPLLRRITELSRAMRSAAAGSTG